MVIMIKKITAKNLRSYSRHVEYPNKHLKCHPQSFESFELIRGRSLLYVTKKKDIQSIECFDEV